MVEDLFYQHFPSEKKFYISVENLIQQNLNEFYPTRHLMYITDNPLYDIEKLKKL